MPYLSGGIGKYRRKTVRFGGLNYAENAREGELADSRGVSCDRWPCLSQRFGHKRLRAVDDCRSIFAWGKLVTVEGETLCYDGKAMGMLTPGRKQFAVVNTKLCVFPDKKYLDLQSGTFGSLEVRIESEAGGVSFGSDTLTFMNACPAPVTTVEFSVREDAPRPVMARPYREQDLQWSEAGGWTLPDGQSGWLRRSGSGEGVLADKLRPGDCLMIRRSEVRGGDQAELFPQGGGTRAAGYDRWGDYFYVLAVESEPAEEAGQRLSIRMERRNMLRREPTLTALDLKPGDAVRISGCVTHPENNRVVKLKAIEDKTLTLDAETLEAGAETGTVTVSREVPDLDFICESNNRLFGVSNAQRTIYASALGDPRNFWLYDGVSTDSYAVAVGSDGDFTACCAYGGGVLFWKENCLHRLVGGYPAAYEVYTEAITGVQKGSEGSLVQINEVLYYKSLDGLYAYSGGIPRLISEALGPVRYDRAVAGGDPRHYYVSMRRQDTGEWELLTYDLRRGLWTKEGSKRALGFARLEGTVYLLSEDQITALDAGEDDDGAPISWSATFTPFSQEEHRRKYPSRLLLRLEPERGSWVEVQLARDGGAFRTLYTLRDRNAPTALIPIRPGRCDSFQLRLRGEGRCLIRSMAWEYALGGVR